MEWSKVPSGKKTEWAIRTREIEWHVYMDTDMDDKTSKTKAPPKIITKIHAIGKIPSEPCVYFRHFFFFFFVPVFIFGVYSFLILYIFEWAACYFHCRKFVYFSKSLRARTLSRTVSLSLISLVYTLAHSLNPNSNRYCGNTKILSSVCESCASMWDISLFFSHRFASISAQLNLIRFSLV